MRKQAGNEKAPAFTRVCCVGRGGMGWGDEGVGGCASHQDRPAHSGALERIQVCEIWSRRCPGFCQCIQSTAHHLSAVGTSAALPCANAPLSLPNTSEHWRGRCCACRRRMQRKFSLPCPPECSLTHPRIPSALQPLWLLGHAASFAAGLVLESLSQLLQAPAQTGGGAAGGGAAAGMRSVGGLLPLLLGSAALVLQVAGE